MRVFTIIVQPANEPMYSIGAFAKKDDAEKEVYRAFDKLKRTGILPGTCDYSVGQFVTRHTLIDILMMDV